jgi:choline-sulfatase
MRWSRLCALSCVLAACTQDGARERSNSPNDTSANSIGSTGSTSSALALRGGAAIAHAQPSLAAPRAEPALEAAAATAAHAAETSAAPALGGTAPGPQQALAYYDFASVPERAELRQDGALVVDFGERPGAKYSFGGWLSGTGRNQRIEGTHALLVSDKVARLALPADGPGAALLVLRARGFASGPLTMYLNNQVAAELKLTGTGFQLFSVHVRAGLLHAGENILQLRVVRTGSALGLANTGLALDWLRLSPPDASADDRAPPALADLRDGAAAGERLRVPSGYTLGFTLEVPDAAELRASMRAPSGATLGVWAVRDGKQPLLVQELSAAQANAPLRIDLAALAGEVTRVELRARGGDVVLEHPAVVRMGAQPERAASTQKPMRNAIVFLVDTLRADKLSAYRSQSRVRTPGLNTFVQGATVMENARSQENWTKPSVATLLSSLLPWQHNTVSGDDVLPESVELMPELLQKRGYYTGAFITNGYCSDKFGFKQGWRTYRNYIREGRPNTAKHVAADVLDWLDHRPKDQPFFLYVHTIDPHVPYKPPQQFLTFYDAQPYAGPIDFTKAGDVLERIKIGRIRPNDRDREHLMALYDAEISYHDVHFAAMMQGLKQRGLEDDTMVVVTADHGEEFWDHGSVGHGHSVYDELLHVPLIVRVPGVTGNGARVPDAVGLVDVMPTVLDALGEKIPEQLVGRSFLPELRGEPDHAPRAAVSGFFRAWRTLVTGRLKLVQHGTERAALYDVKSDPGETKDLAGEQPIALAYTRGLLGLTLAEDAGDDDALRAARNHDAARTAIDAQTEAQLKALGYVGSSRR